jgi:hypothetical protein
MLSARFDIACDFVHHVSRCRVVGPSDKKKQMPEHERGHDGRKAHVKGWP